MKLTVAGENLAERIALTLGVAPVSLMDTHMAFLRARTLMVATRLGIFEALARGPAAPAAVAAACGTSPLATLKLLNALVGAGYLTFDHEQYALSAGARKWLTADSPSSVRDKVLFEFVEWSMTEELETFVRSGTPLDMHDSASPDEWALYQRAMRSLSGLAAAEIVRRTPLPKGASTMLDIGGGHGFISVAMCRKHPRLSATILDLPAAVTYAAPILAREQMGDRVKHWPGNALEDDLGTNAWDFIYVAQLVHHFSAASNRELLRRVARALTPGGLVVVLEMLRPASPYDGGQVGALLDLYFALTSRSGTWSIDEIAGWQRDAGLSPLKPVRLRTVPGAAEVMAVKPR